MLNEGCPCAVERASIRPQTLEPIDIFAFDPVELLAAWDVAITVLLSIVADYRMVMSYCGRFPLAAGTLGGCFFFRSKFEVLSSTLPRVAV